MKVTLPKRKLNFQSAGERGEAVLFIKSSPEEDNDINDIITKVKQSKIRTVVVKGKILDNPELRDLLKMLPQIGKNTILVTEGDDDISVVRNLGKLKIVVNAEVPNDTENKLSNTLMGMLKTDDELFLSITSEKDYLNARKFLTSRPVTQPTVLFEIKQDAEKEFNKIIDLYQADAGKFVFRSRVSI